MIVQLLRTVAIARKEFRQLLRDRLTFGMVVIIPIIQLLMFGYAINTDVRHIRTALLDESHSSLSRQLVLDMQASQVINITDQVNDVASLEQLIREGTVSAAVIIPKDIARRLQQIDRPLVQILIDGSDPQIASSIAQLQQLPLVLRDYHNINHRAGNVSVRILYNPEKRSAVNIVPGLIGVILTMTMILFTSIAIVRERERGNLEMLITTPVSIFELMVGKIIPYILIGLIQTTIILALGYGVFNVPINGSIVMIYTATLIFIAASLTLGLVISTFAKSQLQAMQMTFFIFLPSILLSGFMFPFDGMPKAAQTIAEFFPLTHFIRMIRAIILRAADIGDLLPDLFALLAFMIITMSLAVLRFSKRLD